MDVHTLPFDPLPPPSTILNHPQFWVWIFDPPPPCHVDVIYVCSLSRINWTKRNSKGNKQYFARGWISTQLEISTASESTHVNAPRSAAAHHQHASTCSIQNRIFSIFRVKPLCFWCLVKKNVQNPSILIAGNTINARNTGNVSKMIKTNFELKVTENYLKWRKNWLRNI